jgi:HTH-type transcriptional regulator/antitoxin HigA
MPTEELDDFIARKRPIFSEKQVIGFANRFGVHPGIVVGQLQYRTQRFNLLRTHLTKIRDVVTASAVTDGYGRTFQVN